MYMYVGALLSEGSLEKTVAELLNLKEEDL